MRVSKHLTYYARMAAITARPRGCRMSLLAIAAVSLMARPGEAQPAPEPETPPPVVEAPPAPEQPAPELAPAEPVEIPETSSQAREAAAENLLDKNEQNQVPWTASLLWDHGYGAAGLLRSTGLSYNPTYSWDLLASVGYKFDRDLTLSLSQPMSIEWTDSDSTNTRQEFLFSDTYLSLGYTFLRSEPQPGHAVQLTFAPRILLPTSKASQAGTMTLGTVVRANARYAIADVLSGLVTWGDVRYTRRWNRDDTLQAETAYPCTSGTGDPGQSCAHLGTSNTVDSFLLDVGGELTFIPRWTVGLDISFGWARAAGLDTANVQIDSGTVVAVGDSSATHWRNSRVIELTVGYEFSSWFVGRALVANSFTELGPDGQYRAPFQPFDTAVGLRLEVSFDMLYLATQAHAGG